MHITELKGNYDNNAYTEKLVRSERKTEHALDSMFAYRPHRKEEDAAITLLNLLFKHLEGNGSHARHLFVDFVSAFNKKVNPIF